MELTNNFQLSSSKNFELFTGNLSTVLRQYTYSLAAFNNELQYDTIVSLHIKKKADMNLGGDELLLREILLKDLIKS